MFQQGNNSDKNTEVKADIAKTEQGCSSSQSDAPSSTGTPKRLQNIGILYKDREATCGMIWRESFFFLALVLTTYGALYNAPPKISRQPMSMPFFGRDTHVKDWHRGQLSAALSQMIKFEVSFVMYYAPWDAECQHTRHEFAKAARILNNQVHFSAINCWNPGSECRVQHTKVPSWPVFMVYISTSKSMMYKGPRTAQSMIKFLQLIIRPIQPISNNEELLSLLTECEAVAVGFTPLDNGSRMYNMFYSVALKHKERDPFGDLCFASVTSEKMAYEMGVYYLPNLRLVLWNETLEYSSDDQFTEEGMARWLWNTMMRPSAKIVLPWVKANTFQPFMEYGPALIMFTPLNPLFKHNGFYNLFRAVSMEYHNCEENPSVLDLITLIQKNMIFMESDYKMKAASCDLHFAEILKRQQTQLKVEKPKVVSILKRQWMNKTSCKNQLLKKTVLSHLMLTNNFCMVPSSKMSLSASINKDNNDKSTHRSTLQAWADSEACVEESLSAQDFVLPPERKEKVKISILSSDDDLLSSDNLRMAFYHDMCKTLAFAHKLQEPTFPDNDWHYEKIVGMACMTNLSLSFIALDSIDNHHFAESLGIDINLMPHKTALVILDNKQESQYVMQKTITAASIRSFIRNFTTNNLMRTLKSAVPKLKMTHHYCTSGKKCVEDCTSGLCIGEITSDIFFDFVMEPNKVVIVVHCGGSCEPHTVRAMLAAGRIIRSSNVEVKLGRIDAVQHDLPWSYTASKFPTIVVYPAKRKQESRSYPESQRISTEGILALVLNTIDPPSSIRIRLAIHNQTKNVAAMKKYLSDIRLYVANVINSLLRQWRQNGNSSMKAVIMRRLQSLRIISLSLGGLNTTLKAENSLMVTLHEALNNLEALWKIHVIISPLPNQGGDELNIGKKYDTRHHSEL